jgi:hypothetical protein
MSVGLAQQLEIVVCIGIPFEPHQWSAKCLKTASDLPADVRAVVLEDGTIFFTRFRTGRPYFERTLQIGCGRGVEALTMKGRDKLCIFHKTGIYVYEASIPRGGIGISWRRNCVSWPDGGSPLDGNPYWIEEDRIFFALEDGRKYHIVRSSWWHFLSDRWFLEKKGN